MTQLLTAIIRSDSCGEGQGFPVKDCTTGMEASAPQPALLLPARRKRPAALCLQPSRCVLHPLLSHRLLSDTHQNGLSYSTQISSFSPLCISKNPSILGKRVFSKTSHAILLKWNQITVQTKVRIVIKPAVKLIKHVARAGPCSECATLIQSSPSYVILIAPCYRCAQKGQETCLRSQS